MTFAVGDRVRVTFSSSGFFGEIGIIVAADRKNTLPYRVDLSGSYSVVFGENELELVLETPEVGDTVRVTLDGVVERSEDRDGGVLMVGVSDGGAVWVKAKHAEVVSKAVKGPVVLGVGDMVVEGAMAPVGALATGVGLTPLMFDGKGWVYVTTPDTYATYKIVLSSYAVTFVPPVIDSK